MDTQHVPVLISRVGNFKIGDLGAALPSFSDSSPNPLLLGVCSTHFRSQGDGRVRT